MSVTFYVAKESLKMVNDRVVVIYHEIYPEGFDRTPVVDSEYPEYGAIAPSNPLSLNLSNSNARNILQTLGVDDSELVGCLEPAKLLPACQNALSTLRSVPALDDGTPNRELSGNGPTIILCGHRPGYFEDRFSRLRELAEAAIANEAVIAYA